MQARVLMPLSSTCEAFAWLKHSRLATCTPCVPIFKHGDPSLVNNYRPISLLSLLSKTLERYVHNHYLAHIAPQLYRMQYCFLKGRSTVTQLLAVYQDIIEGLAEGKETDISIWTLAKLLTKCRTLLLSVNYLSSA